MRLFNSIARSNLWLQRSKDRFYSCYRYVFFLENWGRKNQRTIAFGKHISAEKAVEFGLINVAVADEQLQKSVLTMANHLCQNASENSLSATKTTD